MSKFFNNYLVDHKVKYVNPRTTYCANADYAYRNKLHEVVKHDSRFDGTGHHFGSHKNLFHSHKNYKDRA